jgi:hypothetical protein
VAKDTHTIEILLETVFSTRSAQRGYKEIKNLLYRAWTDRSLIYIIYIFMSEHVKYKYIVHCKRPVFSSDRAPHINKPATVREEKISGLKPQMGALFQDRLAD